MTTPVLYTSSNDRWVPSLNIIHVSYCINDANKYTPKYYERVLTVGDMRCGIWVLIANTDYFF